MAEPEIRRKLPRQGNVKKSARGIFSLNVFASEKLALAAKSPNKAKKRRLEAKARESELQLPGYSLIKETYVMNRRKRNYELNNRRCSFVPLYGSELVEHIQKMSLEPCQLLRTGVEQLTCRPRINRYKEELHCYSANQLIQSIDRATERIVPIVDRFLIHVPKTWTSSRLALSRHFPLIEELDKPSSALTKYPGDFMLAKFQIQTPDTRLIQYDCGKLQVMAELLKKLKDGNHRALVFTQVCSYSSICFYKKM